MNIPFVDLKSNYQSIKNEILQAIGEVLDSNSYVLGPKVVEFEKRFALAHNVRHCVALSSGTDGNHMALWALGVGPGDEVIVPANTFIATAWGATLCGAIPVFVDCHPESYTLDPAKAEAAITPKTKAIVAVHLYGQPADLDPLREIARIHKIALVEDAAQSHYAEYRRERIGGLSDVASFSFYPGKNLGAYGEGGAVTTNDDELARKMKMLRDHGSEKKYYHEYYGHNYRMEGIQGAVLGVKMNHIEEWTARRREAAASYNEMLAGIGDLIVPKEMSYAKHVYHLYVVQTSRRDELQKFLQEQGISTGLHYPVPLHLQKCFSHLGYKKGDMPVTERLANNCLSLPMFPELTNDQISFVAESIRRFFAK